ncbi:MAG: helix-turn-helix transcriptional regulator [Candidatus Nanoarchaeia archaeon]
MAKNFLLLLVFFIIFLSFPHAMAQDYYADVTIDVERDGLVTIDGITNHPELEVESSPGFTSKEGRYWIFNISKEETFSSFIYRINFPENAQINYLKTPNLARIEHTDKGLSIIGIGEGEKFFVLVQYSIGSPENGNKALVYLSVIVIIVVLFLGLGLFFYKYYTGYRKEVFYNEAYLTDRQKQILDIIKKNKNEISQREIEIQSGLAKSSVSRNIEGLVLKGI